MNSESPVLLRRLVYGIVLGGIVYAAFALVGDTEELFRHIDDVSLWVVVGACALSSVNYALRFLKWHAYLHLLDIDVQPAHSLNVFLAGLMMSVSPGKVGEVIKSVLLKRSNDISIARSAPVVFAERITDLLGLFVLAGVGIIVFQYGIVAFSAVLIAVFLLIGFLQSPRLVHWTLDRVDKLPILRRYRDDLDRAYGSTQTLMKLRPLTAATLLSAVAWSMEVLAFAWILTSLGVDAPMLFESFFVFSTATLIGALSFLPGGLGLTEGSMAGMLLWLELFDDISPALAATYLIRFTTLWFGVIVGFLSFLLYERLQRRQSDDRTTTPDRPVDAENH